MGYMRHHAIVVSGFQPDAMAAAHAEATRLFPAVSGLTPSVRNHYTSFLIPPDGSQEGWDDESDRGDARRAAFKAWLRAQRDDWYFGWVEVQYADAEHETRVTDDSDAAARAED